MDAAIQAFARKVIKSRHVKGKDVLESGSLNYNGNIRDHIEALNPRSYLTTDMEAGPNVDLVCMAENLPAESADLVISFEMLEHAENWRDAFAGLARAVRFNGWLIVTAPSPGYPYHAAPADYNRFTVEHFSKILNALGMTKIYCEKAPYVPGAYAVGKKRFQPNLNELGKIEVGSVKDPAVEFNPVYGFWNK